MPMVRGAVTRSRELNAPIRGHGHLTVINMPSGAVSVDEDGESAPLPAGKQFTVSEGHPWPRQSGQSDVGGEFFTSKQYVETSPSRSVRIGKVTHPFSDVPSIYRSTQYSGFIWPLNPAALGIGFPPLIDTSPEELAAAGATAIARCKPTNSVADLSTFLGETLKDGLPSLIGSQTWKSRTLNGRNAGKEYLNAEFGWNPLISDVRKFAYAASHASSVIKQYERDAGRNVRRRYSFPSVEKTSITVIADPASPYMVPGSTDTNGLFSGRVIRERVSTLDRWFSGCFTYWLPTGSDSRSALARHALEANKLLGSNLSPETLWNIAPWSWAVDWFSNTGDVISNVSDWATDGLVMRYGYVMQHHITRDTYTYVSDGTLNEPCDVPSLTLVSETKQRQKGNPFGFGVSWDGLSPRQLAITVALGISRGKN